VEDLQSCLIEIGTVEDLQSCLIKIGTVEDLQSCLIKIGTEKNQALFNLHELFYHHWSIIHYTSTVMCIKVLRPIHCCTSGQKEETSCPLGGHITPNHNTWRMFQCSQGVAIIASCTNRSACVHAFCAVQTVGHKIHLKIGLYPTCLHSNEYA